MRTDIATPLCRLRRPTADDNSAIYSNYAGDPQVTRYVLSRRFWRRGIMTAATTTVAKWCFNEAGLLRIWATCAVANPASARVLEKLGMRREGVLRSWHVFPNCAPEPQDCFAYSKLASDD